MPRISRTIFREVALSSVALVILTLDRAHTASVALEANLERAGRLPDEIVHVDNGSFEPLPRVVKHITSKYDIPFTQVLFSKNTGTSQGYNAGIGVARSDWIVLDDSDLYFPDKWGYIVHRYITHIPNTALARFEKHSEPALRLGSPRLEQGLPIIPSHVQGGCRFFPRKRCYNGGYLREDFGVYGWEDIEQTRRTVAQGGLTYTIPGHYITDVLVELEKQSYFNTKQNALKKNQGKEKLESLAAAGFPPYFP